MQIMETINIPFDVYWRFKKHPEYKVTREKQIINSNTKKILKYNQRGFFIKGRYYKRHEINNHVEKIPEQEYCPFSNGTIKLNQ